MRHSLLALLTVVCPLQDDALVPVDLMSGEVTATSVLVQARLPGEAAGWIVFELGDMLAETVQRSEPLRVGPETGFIARARFEGLAPGRLLSYRALGGLERDALHTTEAAGFRTLPGAGRAVPTRFAVVTGLNQAKFEKGYRGEDRAEGYPALRSLLDAQLDFLVLTGDSVYYDYPQEGRAKTADEMRAKWRAQLAQPRMRELLRHVPAYWMKDDHDHRFNDCDTTGEEVPSSELGIALFREQVPVVASGDDESPTWRTHRVSRDLQIWLVEGRDHRSANALPDGPDKTLWGAEQRAWLERTLLASDATYRVLISPTPLVGPDDAYKKDNHTNPKGFRHEGEAFLAWARAHDLPDNGFVVACGDRHWQYQSVHPSGVQEFSCGALVDANARLGRKPGDPQSTDPDARIQQPYVSRVASGGFLLVEVALEDEQGVMDLRFMDEHGVELHAVRVTR